MQIVTRIFIALTACAAFTGAGCGQTGALYLPDDATQSVPPDDSADASDDQQ